MEISDHAHQMHNTSQDGKLAKTLSVILEINIIHVDWRHS